MAMGAALLVAACSMGGGGTLVADDSNTAVDGTVKMHEPGLTRRCARSGRPRGRSRRSFAIAIRNLRRSGSRSATSGCVIGSGTRISGRCRT